MPGSMAIRSMLAQSWRTGKAPYAEFSDAVKKAEGQALVGWLALIDAAARNGQWQAAPGTRTPLPKLYGRRTGDEVKPGQTITLLVKYENALDDARERLGERLNHLSNRHREGAMP